MRTSTLARGGALLTAVTVAFTLGSGPASASDSHDQTAHAKLATRSFAKGVAPTKLSGSKLARALGSAHVHSMAGVPGAATITEYKQKNIAMYGPGKFIWDGSVTSTGLAYGQEGGINYMYPHVFVGGKDRGAQEFAFATPPYENGTGIIVPSTIATGKARLGPTTISYGSLGDIVYQDTVSNKHSNYFYIRRGTVSTASGTGTNYPLYIVIGSKHISFHANHWKIFKQSDGTLGPLSSVKLQYRLHHKWVTLKTIKLNAAGSGSYTKTKGAKHSYRLYYPTSDTIYNSYTEATPNL